MDFCSKCGAKREQDETVCKHCQTSIQVQPSIKRGWLFGGIVSSILGVISVAASVIYGCCFTYSGVALSYADDGIAALVHSIDRLMESLLFVGIGLLVLSVILFVLHWKSKK